ncbi:MAG: tRNA 4-thiouridine(8) synthase ThiI [Spirochaetales bacterium]|jgi:tRNA uracil 4-sulfurtransferase|nr:tRNA 4-thiouridine(8) synthase ThiI [Spirochaetales bacterium]
MLFLIKIGEISLKGGNRGYFEKKLVQNIKRRLKPWNPKMTVRRNRFYLDIDETHRSIAESVLSTTFGIVGFSPTDTREKTYEDIRHAALEQTAAFTKHNDAGTFKIEARRSDKSFHMDSYGIATRLGDDIRASHPELSVDVRNPDLKIRVEVREKAYIYSDNISGPGGLPVGVAGKGILLLSGGIDSPVAAYLMAKRGLTQDAAYFHTYPYTSDEALEKVKELSRILSYRCGGINLFTIPFTDAALRIRQRAPLEETTLLMRACMMKTASDLAGRGKALCLITGEALSQVASQTAQSMRFTESTSDLPTFRPLIGMDKEEIIKIAKKIGTYDTSVLPFEDCCTVFSPDKPLIKPDFERMSASFKNLEIDDLLETAVETAERTWFPPLAELS